jgi:hypothetical protein
MKVVSGMSFATLLHHKENWHEEGTNDDLA